MNQNHSRSSGARTELHFVWQHLEDYHRSSGEDDVQKQTFDGEQKLREALKKTTKKTFDMKTTVPMFLASLEPDQHLSCEMTSQEFIIKSLILDRIASLLKF